MKWLRRKPKTDRAAVGGEIKLVITVNPVNGVWPEAGDLICRIGNLMRESGVRATEGDWVGMPNVVSATVEIFE